MVAKLPWALRFADDQHYYPSPMKSATYTIAGVIYGLVLLLLGFAAAGFGEGVFVPLNLFSSPIGILLEQIVPPTPQFQVVILVTFPLGMALLWGSAGWLSAFMDRPRFRRGLLALLAVHYAGFIVVFLSGDWSYFPRVWQKMPELLVVGFSVYALGQAALWAVLLRGHRQGV